MLEKNGKITALYRRLSRDDFGKDDDQQREQFHFPIKGYIGEFAARRGLYEHCPFHGRWH